MRKDNEVYKSYYELYSQFNFYLEDAKSLLQECKGNAKDNCMMECTMNLNVRYYKNRTKNEDFFFDSKLNFLAIKNDDHFLHNETIFAVTSKEGRQFENCLEKTNNEHYG